MTAARRIGFVGLGVAGSPMARNLLAAGFPLQVYDRERSRVEAFAALGAEAASSSRDAAAGCDTVVTLLPGAAEVLEAMLGPDGVVEGARPGATAIDFSTVDPQVSLDLQAGLSARGIAYLDAAVMGVPTVAEAGELGIFAAGDEALVAAHGDLFAAVGSATFYMGATGNAKRAKIANNTFSVLCRLALYEVCGWLEANGVELERYVDVLRDFSARPMANPADRLRELLDDGWDTTGRTGRVGTLDRDLHLGLEIAHAGRLPMPLTATAVQLLDVAMAHGLAGEGPSSMAKIFELLSGPET